MDKIIKEILTKIESEGYEAYIVGGFVRDKLLKKASYDVDICTNALPMTLKNVFNISQNSNGYGGFNLKIKKYNIDITTYRKEVKYNNRRPVEIEYISNLFEDINRRDFTINALCMDKNDNIIDLINGSDDLKKHVIRIIGDADQKFKDDPLRMLRAIRFATILDFFIEKETYQSIIRNSKFASSLSSARIKEELSKILAHPNYAKGLKILKNTGIDKEIGLEYESINYTNDILGMWAQVNIPNLEFTKTEKDNIIRIKQLVKFGRIGYFELFNYGLYLCSVAAQILHIDRNVVNSRYHKMPIKSMKDIAISGSEIIKLLNIEPGKIVSEIIGDIKIQILGGKLKNKNSVIKKYVIRKWQNEQK